MSPSRGDGGIVLWPVRGCAGESGRRCRYDLLLLLPFIEQDPLYKQLNGNSLSIQAQIIKTYVCPSDPSVTNAGGYGGCGVMNGDNIQRNNYGSSSYAANAMVFDPADWSRSIRRCRTARPTR